MNIKLFSAANNLRAVDAMFASAGLDLEQMLAANDPDALKKTLAAVAAQAKPRIEDAKPADEEEEEKPASEEDEEEEQKPSDQPADEEEKPTSEEDTEDDEEDEEEEKPSARRASAGKRIAGIESRAILAGFVKAGIKVTAADKAKGITADDITAALTAHVSKATATEIAKRGLGKFPGDAASADPTTAKPAAANLTGIDRVKASLAAKRAA